MITIEVGNNFNIQQIADSGQCFRMVKVPINGKVGYKTIYKEHYIEIYQDSCSSTIEASCDLETFKNIWEDYFDLKVNYSDYENRLLGLNDKYITNAYNYGKGIRILRQEPFETLISFIISQQKKIPNIMKTVDNLCNVYGTKLEDKFTGKKYYTFPSAEDILSDISKLDDLKLGYRDKYIIDACENVKRLGIEWFSTVDVYNRALTIKGVGAKVANCYALFGCHDLSRFPVDTWINRILLREYPEGLYLTNCQDFAGLIQQYMFFYERSIN